MSEAFYLEPADCPECGEPAAALVDRIEVSIDREPLADGTAVFVEPDDADMQGQCALFDPNDGDRRLVTCGGHDWYARKVAVEGSADDAGLAA